MARATAVTAALRHPGSVSVLADRAVGRLLARSDARHGAVAWMAGGRCRAFSACGCATAGNVLEGFRVQLLRISTQIPGGSDCPNTSENRLAVRGARSAGGPALWPDAARGRGSSSLSDRARAAGRRDCSASGSGIPPRGGAGGSGGRFGPRPQPSSPSPSERRAVPGRLVTQRREQEHTRRSQAQQMHPRNPQQHLGVARHG